MRTPQPSSTMTATFANRDMPFDSKKKAANSGAAGNPSIAARASKGFSAGPRLTGIPLPHSSPLLAKDGHREAVSTPKATLREDIVTPVNGLLSSNITPRSGSRKARVDSPSSTPNRSPTGTSTNSRPASIIKPSAKLFGDVRGVNGLGLRDITTGGKDFMRETIANGKASNFSPRGNTPKVTPYIRNPPSPDSTPMFFHASDIKKVLPRSDISQPSRNSAKPRSVSSICGDGDYCMDETSSPTSSPIENAQPKFFYANGLPEAESLPPLPRSTTTSLVSSRPSPKQTISLPQNQSHLQRAPSPLKDVEVPAKTVPGSPNSQHRISRASISSQKPGQTYPVASPASQTEIGRRSSIKAATVPQVRHTKASSVSSIDFRSTRKASLATSGLKPLTASPVSASNAQKSKPPIESHANYQNPSAVIAELPSSPSVHLQRPLSVPKSSPAPETKFDQLNALASNARRERKVLDLEISNSSLLAINRTLEREMRKQTAELRRYRRLTSAGRISIAPSHSSRLSTFTAVDGSSEFDLDDSLSLSSASVSEDEDSSPSTASNPLSPSSRSTQAARQRARDEKRLRLDLSKHQELLLDSQRMNQSLKRCLGWTEDLISEGKRALAYQARVGEEEVRGRVLTPDEMEEEVVRGRGLLSPRVEKVEDPWEKIGANLGEGEGEELD